MRNEKTRILRFCSLLLVGMMLLSPMMQVRAVSQYDIEQLQEKRAALAARAEEQQAAIDAMAETQTLCVTRKLALDQRIETNREEIRVISEQVELYDEMLREKEEELMEAISAEEAQSKQLRVRMRAMEENGRMSYVSVLLASGSLTDLLSRIADISDITQYDRDLEKKYRDARSDKEDLRGEYQELLNVQEGIRAELADKQAYLDTQVEAAAALLAQIDENSDRANEEFAAMQLALDEADAEIDTMIRALEEQRRAEAAAAAAAEAAAQQAAGVVPVGAEEGASGSSGASATGSLAWPVPNSSLVTSRYGGRDAPTAGASTNHQALDIGASAGSSIVAAGEGTVVFSGSNSGYGNYVIIDHGDGTTTLYAHMQESAVTEGQHVSSEQVIGYVGSTGIATGPHLHYEVRVNGETTDPEAYYSGTDHWNC